MEEIIGRLPTIPEYYRLYINKDVDLLKHPKQCCPFHKEDTPSFSYAVGKGIWYCFGGCHTGGDVVALHKKNYNFRTREEAEKSLKGIFKVRDDTLTFTPREVYVDEDRVRRESLMAKLSILANTSKRWLELDYVMSLYPVEEVELLNLLQEWTSTEERKEEL